ncbi:MAG: ImmA/IrrE family metallo-endopeptidase [Erysipelotrichaceae bacterium]|nr:ImmA/IrrE family metallo-endopeptidase [Erysipelotrichaceae bacterium]
MIYKLSAERYEEIKEIVVDLFVRLSIQCIPISGFEIATKLGVIVVPYSSKTIETRRLMLEESEDGFSVKKGGYWYIFYNDENEYRRINNTICHECGHIVLDHSEASELAEAEANFFAKYALAPPVLIHKLKLQNPYEIYNHFDISLEASDYAYSYYRKWLTYGHRDYTNYELRLLQQFA